MSTIPMLREGLCWTAMAAITVCFSLPAAASEIYSWRTEDGGYAYTDDAKAIPPRYRDRAQTQQTKGISSYKRLTSPPAGTMDPGDDAGGAIEADDAATVGHEWGHDLGQRLVAVCGNLESHLHVVPRGAHEVVTETCLRRKPDRV